jgi:hypothetical protein
MEAEKSSMEQTMDHSRLVRLSPLILGAAVILFAVFSVYLTGFRVETDKDEYLVGEKVTASIIRFNYFPFPIPQPAVTKMEFSCTLNSEPLREGYSACLTPTGPFFLMSPGSGVWLEPVTVTPHVSGSLVFTAKIGSESPVIYEKTVKVNPAPGTPRKPAWLRVNRFNVTYPPVTIVDVESIDFDGYPRLLEAFEVEEKSYPLPHPYEWVNCTHIEGVEIVELFGRRYEARDEAFEDYVFAIRYKDVNYFVIVFFSWDQPLIQ